MFKKGLVAGLLALVSAVCLAKGNVSAGQVTRATLDNGLRVVIVRDALAPVVSVQMNYLVGSNESPAAFPGTAHAVEHMMFRGSPGLSRNQLLTIASNMGGGFNATTTHELTRYYFTVPAQDLEVALRIAAIRMRGVDMHKADWLKERGAVEQEVSRNHSNPGYKLGEQLRQHLFAGTPYTKAAAGTRESLNKNTAAMLKQFHDTWYAPNNAILVIAGDVDAAKALDKIKSLFGSIPRKSLPARPTFHLQPVSAVTYQSTGDVPVGMVGLSWRMPSLRSKQYATALVLADAMASKRGKLFEMGLTHKALYATFIGSLMPHAGMGAALAVYPKGGDAQQTLTNLKSVMAGIVKEGLPAELVQAAKRRRLADMGYRRNSVAGLASAWSLALVSAHWSSPDAQRADFAAVTVDDVNAMLRRILVPEHMITIILTPHASGKPVSRAKFGGVESFNDKPTGKVELPDWAKAAFAKLSIPATAIHPTSFTLANGLRVMVQPETVSQTVEVYGRIRTNGDMQQPEGKMGVSGLLGSMFRFGTTSLERKAFQTALDQIAAHESAGYDFSLAVPSQHFAKGMQLLSEHVLQPAMPERMFGLMQKHAARTVVGYNQSPGFQRLITLDRALYPKDFPGLRYKTKESINGLTLADVKNYHRKTFRPDMAAIVIIGDVTPKQARKVVTATFGQWKANGPKPDVAYPAVPPNKPSQFVTPDASARQSSVTLAATMPLTEGNQDIYAMNLGLQILGTGGFNTRLMRDLRVNNGLVYGVSSDISVGKHESEFFVHYGCDPDKIVEARAMVIHDIRQMQTEPVTAAELRAAKSKLLRQYPLGESSFGAIAGRLLNMALGNKPLDTTSITARKYKAVTAEQIQQAFKKYVRPDAFVTAIRGPGPTN